jgi:hypothetical protein
LLEKFEHDLGVVVFLFDDIQSFVELLTVVLSLDSLHFKDIERYFSHFNSVQFSRPRVSSFPNEPIIIPSVILLILSQIFLMLIKLGVQIEKVNAGNIDFIHILQHWVARRDTNIPD